MMGSHPEASATEDRHALELLIAVPIVWDIQGVTRIAGALESPLNVKVSITLAIIDNCPSTRKNEVRSGGLDGFPFPTIYIREPRSGIPFARNTAIAMARARDVDALIFIDDDEWPAPGWLESLVTTWQRTGANIVLGPSRGVLPPGAPPWASTSGVFNKDRRLTDGGRIRTAYSYNTLLDRRTIENLGPTFDSVFRYTGASDHDYFKRATDAGLRSVWSAGALVYEEVGSDRVNLRWVLKRGYRIGVGARVSSQRRLPRRRVLARLVLLVVANGGYTVINAVGTWLPNLSWVEALRRCGIVAGLVLGNMLRYKEYGEASGAALQPDPFQHNPASFGPAQPDSTVDWE